MVDGATELIAPSNGSPEGHGATVIVRRAGMAFGIQVGGAGVAYILQVTLARVLGAADYGSYALILVLANIVALLVGLGLPAASVRYVPEYRAKEDAARLHGFVHLSSRVSLGLASAVALLISIFALVANRIGVLTDPALVVIGSLLLPALAGSIRETELARASGRMRAAYIPTLALRPALTAIILVAAYLIGGGLSAAGALGAAVVASYLTFLCQHFLREPVVSNSESLPTERIVEFRSWLGVGVPLMAASAFTVTLMQADIVAVGVMRGSAEAGVYAAASKTATLAAFVLMAVNSAAAPRFAELWTLGRRDELQRLLSRLSGIIFWPTLAIAIGIGLLSTLILQLFGGGFESARPALLVLLLGQVINALAGPVGYLLNVTGHHREAMRALGCSAIFSLVVALLGAMALGAVGAAIGATLGMLLWNSWLYWLAVRRLGLRASVLGSSRVRSAPAT